jgi:hypothetical protein
VQLSWHAPAGCPGVEDVRARIRELAGDATATDTPLRAEATVVRSSIGRWQLKLIVHADELVGVRELDANACEDLAAATAVNLALLLGATPPPMAAVAPAPAIAPDARVTSAPPPRPALAARPPASAEPDDPRRSLHALLQLPLLAASIGPLPRPSWGAALAAGIQLQQWRVFVAGGAWLRQQLTAASASDTGAHVDRIELGVRACYAFSFARFELAPCAALSLQHIWARGEGGRVSARTAQASWLGPALGAQARLALTDWFGLVAQLDAQLQTARPRIAIDGVGRVGQLGPAAFTFWVGSEWIL